MIINPTELFSLFQLIDLVLGANFTVLVQSNCFARSFQQKKQTINYSPSTKCQTDKVRILLVHIVEHLAAIKPDISLRGWVEAETQLILD